MMLPKASLSEGLQCLVRPEDGSGVRGTTPTGLGRLTCPPKCYHWDNFVLIFVSAAFYGIEKFITM